MMAQVGAGATGWNAIPSAPSGSNVEDGWRSLADVLSQPVRRTPPPLPSIPRAPKRSDWASPVETGVTLAAVAAARAKIPVTEIRGPSRKPNAPEPAWSTSERRLWWMAGGLMLLAVAVLSTLALLTFGRAPATAAIAPAIHNAAAPASKALPTVVASAAPTPSASAAAPAPASAAPSIAPSAALAPAHSHAVSHAAAHGAAHRVRRRHHHRAHHR